jgi:phosphatidylglycerophosphate synthase
METVAIRSVSSAGTPYPMVSMGSQYLESPAEVCDGSPATLANGISLSGYALGIWWLAGGPSWAAVASILADELDGRVARAMNQASCMGD